MKSEESQIRATFIDTKKKQKLFRKKLYILIEENRTLTQDEKEEFYDLLADSTLGLGTIPVTLWLDNGNKKIEIDSLAKFIKDIIEYNPPNGIINGDFLFFSLGRYSNYNIEIKEIWKQILSKCGHVHESALAESVRISKEQTHLGVSDSGKV